MSSVSAAQPTTSYAPPAGEAPRALGEAPALSAGRTLLLGAAGLLAAVPIALAIAWLNGGAAGSPERGVKLVALLCAALLPLPTLALVATRRRAATPLAVGLTAMATVTVLLAGIALYWLWGTIAFPADFVIWSESDFVNDIIKLRAGYPLYSDQANNESFTYSPGSQLLTYALASLAGQGTSVVAFRVVQLAFTIAASLFAALSVREILRLAGARAPRPAWALLWAPALFLIAGNETTNAYIVNLHNDALAQLVSAAGFWLLLRYAATRDLRILALMTVVPVAGFAAKQSVLIWGGLYGVHLLLFDRPRSWRRIVAFGAVSGALLAAALGVAWMLWGRDFFYWTFTVPGKHAVEPLRSLQHVLDAWIYFAVGIGAALVLLRGPALRTLVGPWLVWLALLATEAYTSGVAWMLNHMGPGSLIAGVWLLAAATRLWEAHGDAPGTAAERWMRPAAAVAIAGLVASGLAVVRIPTPPYTPDARRYVREIEREFQGLPADRVLLDAGSWVYLRDGVVMKDRAPSIGERGYSQTGDFSGILRRIGERRYAKILVRNWGEGDFWYDHEIWDRPSGIRAALQANYREAGRIAAVDMGGRKGGYLFNAITVLVPR